MIPKLTMTRILRRSLVHRRARSVAALVALTVSAGVATALFTLYANLDAKLHHEFRSFGANVVITPAQGASLPPDALDQVKQVAGNDALAAEFSYAVATTDRGKPVVIAGSDLDAVRKLDAWWSVDAWPGASDTNAALIGQRAANFIADEHDVRLAFNGHTAVLHGAGRLKTGGEEDSRIYMPMPAFAALTAGSAPTTVIEVQVPGGAANVEAAIKRLTAAYPALHVQPVRQLVEGETRIVDRTRSLMYAAVLLIALTVSVSVLATLSASVFERRRDFALMMALGGSQLQLLSIFLFESLLLALTGAAAGFIVGSGLAWIISEVNFRTATLPRVQVLPLVLLLNMAIAVLAALLPARRLRQLQPAALLKGE